MCSKLKQIKMTCFFAVTMSLPCTKIRLKKTLCSDGLVGLRPNEGHVSLRLSLKSHIPVTLAETDTERGDSNLEGGLYTTKHHSASLGPCL